MTETTEFKATKCQVCDKNPAVITYGWLKKEPRSFCLECSKKSTKKQRGSI